MIERDPSQVADELAMTLLTLWTDRDQAAISDENAELWLETLDAADRHSQGVTHALLGMCRQLVAMAADAYGVEPEVIVQTLGAEIAGSWER